MENHYSPANGDLIERVLHSFNNHCDPGAKIELHH